jgi:hypothetical protein
LPPKNDPASEPESQPSDLFSNAEARAMIEEFREAIRAGVLRVTPENEVQPVRPRAGDTARQPEPSASKEDDIAQLMEWFERRREQKAQEMRRKEAPKASAGGGAEPSAGSIRQRVIERVAHKVVETWDHADQESDPANSLREQIVERISDDILRRLQRNLE